VFRSAATCATAGAHSGARAAGTHSTSTLRGRQTDAGKQYCCGQQEPALNHIIHLNLLRCFAAFLDALLSNWRLKTSEHLVRVSNSGKTGRQWHSFPFDPHVPGDQESRWFPSQFASAQTALSKRVPIDVQP